MTDEELSIVAQARLASGLTIGDAASITGMSTNEYKRIENRPLCFSVGEFKALCAELNSDGEAIIARWMDTFFGL